MTTESDGTKRTGRAPSHDHEDPPVLVDDMLPLFQRSSGTIGGETALFCILGGPALADLAMRGLIVGTEDGADRVTAHGSTPPREELLRPVWEHLARASRHPRTVIAAIGPLLMSPRHRSQPSSTAPWWRRPPQELAAWNDAPDTRRPTPHPTASPAMRTPEGSKHS